MIIRSTTDTENAVLVAALYALMEKEDKSNPEVAALLGKVRAERIMIQETE